MHPWLTFLSGIILKSTVSFRLTRRGGRRARVWWSLTWPVRCTRTTRSIRYTTIVAYFLAKQQFLHVKCTFCGLYLFYSFNISISTHNPLGCWNASGPIKHNIEKFTKYWLIHNKGGQRLPLAFEKALALNQKIFLKIFGIAGWGYLWLWSQARRWC